MKKNWSKIKGTHLHILNPLRLEGGIDVFEEDIKEVVTKEMMESISFKV